MLEVIENWDEIRKVQARFERELNKSAQQQGAIKVGSQGWSEKTEVSWNELLGIWWGFDTVKSGYWNAFGTEEPDWIRITFI